MSWEEFFGQVTSILKVAKDELELTLRDIKRIAEDEWEGMKGEIKSESNEEARKIFIRRLTIRLYETRERLDHQLNAVMVSFMGML